MTKRVLVIAATLALAGAENAEAGGDVTTTLEYGLVTGGVYAGVTGSMVVHDLVKDRPGLVYSIAETAWNLPIALAWGRSLTYDIENDAGHPVVDGALMAVHIALTAHAVYEIVERDRESSKPPPGTFTVGGVHASVTPTPMAGGGGLGLVGAF